MNILESAEILPGLKMKNLTPMRSLKMNRSVVFITCLVISGLCYADMTPQNVTVSPAISSDGSFTVSWDKVNDHHEDYGGWGFYQYCMWMEIDILKDGQYVGYIETTSCDDTSYNFAGYSDGTYSVEVYASIEEYGYDYYSYDEYWDYYYYGSDPVQLTVSTTPSPTPNPYPDPDSVTYIYDALGRLTFVYDNINGNRDYDYDAAGNRTTLNEGPLQDQPN